MMSDFSKKDEFHVPFIKNLAFIGLVTIVSMITTHFLVVNYLPNLIQNQEYTIQQSQIEPD
jgi:uncharacterized membrane protein